ncbi:hypothetical protein BH11PLA1_BH11PLA1_14320 [soil metagenome]
MAALISIPTRWLALRFALATVWAWLLSFGGVWALLEWPARFPAYRGACIVGGVTALAMGAFVFAALVADRAFPAASRWASWAVQVAAGGVFTVGLAGLALVLSGVFA